MTIKWNQSGDIGEMILARPERRNAMNPALVDAAFSAMAEIDRSASVRALILSGEGPGFCAGSDLRALAQMTGEQQTAFEHESGRLARRIADMQMPVIAKVRGFAIGGGLTLAAACDIVVTHEESRWSLPEVPIGLFPAWGLGYVEARLGTPTARRLCFGIDSFTGAEAFRIGMADHLVDEKDLDEFTENCAQNLSKLPAEQVKVTKTYFRIQDQDVADNEAALAFDRCSRTTAASETFEKYGGRSMASGER